MMLRGLVEGTLRGEGKPVEEGRTPGVEKRFEVTNSLLEGRERYLLSVVRRVERGSHLMPFVMQREHDGSYHMISAESLEPAFVDSQLCHIVSLLLRK